MAKSAHIIVAREDYEWMIQRFGNDGVRPGAGELSRRMRARITFLETAVDDLQSKLAELKEVKNEH